MDILESVIMRYAATDHSTVVIPQYDIGEAGHLWIFLPST